MIGLCIVVLAFGILWIANWKRKRAIVTPSGALLGAYCLCSLCTVYLCINGEIALDLAAAGYYALALGLLLLPIVWFDETQSIDLEACDNKIAVIISYALALLGVYSIIFNTPAMFVALRGNLAENRLFSGSNIAGIRYLPAVIATYGAYLFSLMLPLGFYWLARRSRTYLGIALLVGSFAYVVYVLKFVGRDATLLWSAAFIFNYLLYRKNLFVETRKWLVRMFAAGFCFLCIVFVLVTVSRFSKNENPVFYSIVNYAGQSPINFSDQYLANREPLHGKMNFPIVYRIASWWGILEHDENAGYDYVKYILETENYSLNVFSSLVGSWMTDFGKAGTFLFVVSLGFSIIAILRQDTKRIRLWQTIIYTCYLQIMFGGIFYYFYFPNVGNATIILSFAAAAGIKYSENVTGHLIGKKGYKRKRYEMCTGIRLDEVPQVPDAK